MVMALALALATVIAFAMAMAMGMLSMSMRMIMSMSMRMRFQHEHEHGDNPQTCFVHDGPSIALANTKTATAGHTAAEAKLGRRLCSSIRSQAPEHNPPST